MKNEFDEKQDLSQAPDILHNQDPRLSPRQAEIYRNLEAIGPEIAAFYLDGIRILQNNDLETAANLLAHITREIDGGLRNILSENKKAELEFLVETPDGNKSTYEKEKEDDFEFCFTTPGTVTVTYKRIGKHKASILQSLGINEPSPLAERWLEVTGEFHKFAHRRGAGETPREKETFIPLWNEFEDVLQDLVGNYLNLLSKVVDRILNREPTKEIRRVLPNLLKSETRCKYFFKNLNSPDWLGPLKEDRWFDPESNVVVRPYTTGVIELDWSDWWKPLIDSEWFDSESNSLTETRTRTITDDRISPWYALEYVERVAEHIKKYPCKSTIDTLAEILDTIVGCADDTREKIVKDRTLRQRMIKIIATLPEDRKKSHYNVFEEYALENEYKDAVAHWLHARRFIDNIEQNNLALREFLSNMSRADRIKFPKEISKAVNGENRLTEQGLANIYREYVVVILQRFTNCLSVFQDTLSPDQYSTLSGLLTALQDTKQIDWEALLGFIHGILSSEDFWTDQETSFFKYRKQFLADAAELIVLGVNDDTYAFDSQLLPLVEQILLVLVENTESKCTFEKSPMATFLNSPKGMVFQAILNYALRFARMNDNQQADFLWPRAIRADFTKRLDKNIESSFEFSFALGAFLPQLLYLDKEWVINNIERIFLQQDEHRWYVTFSMYLVSSRKICKFLYFSFSRGGHYQKALNTNFAHRTVETALATHICTFWLEDYENLDDKTSLIYQVLNSDNLNFLYAVIQFFWDRKDNLSARDKAKIRPAWRILFKVLSQGGDSSDAVNSSFALTTLPLWIIFIDDIDEEALTWLKFCAKHTHFYFDVFVDALLKHAPKTPEEVGTIYLELSKVANLWLYTTLPGQDKVTKTIRFLYSVGHKKIADRICIQFAKTGFTFLKPVYDEHQN